MGLLFSFIIRSHSSWSFDSDSSGRPIFDCIHFLGGKERLWFLLHGSFLVYIPHYPHCFWYHSGNTQFTILSFCSIFYCPTWVECVRHFVSSFFSFLSLLGVECALLYVLQAFFPLGPISTSIYAGVGALIFCGYIIFDTDNLIKRFSYDEYIWASVVLYLDILNLFLMLLDLLKANR
mgnify:FL=1